MNPFVKSFWAKRKLNTRPPPQPFQHPPCQFNYKNCCQSSEETLASDAEESIAPEKNDAEEKNDTLEVVEYNSDLDTDSDSDSEICYSVRRYMEVARPCIRQVPRATGNLRDLAKKSEKECAARGPRKKKSKMFVRFRRGPTTGLPLSPVKAVPARG
ncbi:hypothetical protein CJU90_1043 [Yarrowia sp. C11]|nr:hypothetical protein CKK34_2456 [Yarrowia sp. E02]KAG5373349.1 hypothetical protein CJU90_1043 [Yarrowia sp. C11]